MEEEGGPDWGGRPSEEDVSEGGRQDEGGGHIGEEGGPVDEEEGQSMVIPEVNLRSLRRTPAVNYRVFF